MANILNFMEQTAAALRLEGGDKISLAYITAEFAPFSSAQKPDIVAIRNGAASTNAYVVEYSEATIPSDLEYFSDILREHKEFVISSSEIPCGYAFATNQKISDDLKSRLWETERVKLIDEISSPESLAKRFNNWVNLYQPSEVAS